MNLSQAFFHKDIIDLKIEDLEDFFKEEKEESFNLEFKSGDVELEKIYREICAFLNTDGGMLIVGAPREIVALQKNVCFGDLIPNKKIKNQDSLSQLIASHITPSPGRLKIKQLSFKDGLIYIIEVPQSLHPPHQVTSEGKYYIRLDKETKSAPHGIIEALFYKRQKPDLNIAWNFYSLKDDPFKHSYFDFNVENNSIATAESIGYIIEIHGDFKVVKNKTDIPLHQSKNKITIRENTNSVVLVKGISMEIGLGLEIYSENLLITSAVWAKDSILVNKTGIFNAEKFEIIMNHSSKESSNLNSVEEIYQFFYGENQPPPWPINNS